MVGDIVNQFYIIVNFRDLISQQIYYKTMKNVTFILIILAMLVPNSFPINCDHYYIQYRCNGRYNYPWSWHYSSSWDTNQCWENDDRNFISCSNPSGYQYHFGYNSGWSDTITLYRTCHSYCATCNGRGCGSCQSCNSPYNRWLRSSNYCCTTYCPNEGTGQGSSRGQYANSDNTCAYCHSYCSWCNYGGAVTDCITCVSGYYLIDDQNWCTTQYTDGGSGPEHTCYSRRCVSSCPTKYYFAVAEGSTTNSKYSSWTGGATWSGETGSTYHYRRMTNICYLCDDNCEECWDRYDTNCYKCSRYHYMWRQQNYRCQEQCPMGAFGSGSAWRGQYVQTSTTNNSAHADYRICQLCDANCVWCQISSSNCYHCKDNSTLLDTSAQCVARFNTTHCPICTQGSLDGCTQSDNYCRSGGCPEYFYFQVYRTTSSSSEYGVTNSIYDWITKAVTEHDDNGTNHWYRRQTDFCMLCDYRCMKCTGPRNVHCSQCVNNYYKWTNDTVCDTVCPPGQYNEARDQSYPNNQTKCFSCMSRCQLCAYRDENCSRCVGHNYDFTNSSAGYLYAYDDDNSTCLQDCPTSSSPLTEIGWYGSIKTRTCYPCPDPCSNCNIDMMINTGSISYFNCGTDQLCSDGLICTSCLSGTALVAGKCIDENQCRDYAYFLPSDTSTQWSADNCQCLPGHSSTSYASCNIRCHEYCKTCTGTGSSQCASCEDGYSLSGSTCTSSNTGRSYWIRGEGSGGGSAVANGNANWCGTLNTHFGFRQFTSNKYFRQTVSTLTQNYYAISVKMTLVFIDEWPEAGTIFLHRDSTSTSNIVWSWSYDDKGAYGEQLCGTNKMDYVLSITAEITTRNTTSQDIYLTTNQDLLNTATGIHYDWGIHAMIITGLKCHSDCSRCTGPLQTDCITCADSKETLVNGTCQCKISSNYYKWPDGSCTSGCPSNYYRDEATVSCVNPPTNNCSAPKRFGYKASGSTYGDCMETCPTNYYASMTDMLCTTNCGTHGQYKYDGASRTCEDVCPNGFIADPSTNKCVQKCPTNYYLKLEDRDTNPMCATVCPTGWAYADLQTCVTDCPNGYFKQTLSGQNKCVKTCTNAFGDNSTNSCVTECPFPTYADPQNDLCVDTCSDDSYFMQVAVSDLNRTCVTQCQSGQYGDPYTRKCSNYTLECPDGFYADSHTHMCERTCTQAGQVAENSTKKCQSSCTTGFAYWAIRMCVDICPTNPSMFAKTSTKQCVSSCDFSNTGLFGDTQANRTCVEVCSATPVETFGQNATSLCVEKCTRTSEYGDPFHEKRYCVTACTSSPTLTYAYSVTKMCVSECPDSYYGDPYTTPGSGICAQSCPDPYFGQPQAHICKQYCKWTQFGYPVGSRPCVYTCPQGWFGRSRLCRQTCPSGTYADKQTNICVTSKDKCSNDTYGDYDKALCVINTNCTDQTYADPFTKGCQTNCSNNYFADDNINTCVEMCSDDPDEFGQWGKCRSGCISGYYADYQYNRRCRRNCTTSPVVLYANTATFRCVQPFNCPTDYYGNNNTGTCVDPCSGSLPFGDPISRMCVKDCPDGYYGDSDDNLCVQVCDFSTLHYADNQTGNCQTLCTLGTFGVNATSSDHVPSCEYDCPVSSYARDSDRICVANCGSGLYGDPIKGKCYSDPHDCSDGYYGHSEDHMCVIAEDCQHFSGGVYFAQNSTKTCVSKCQSPNYGDSKTFTCEPVCNTTSYGQNTTRLCLTSCKPYGSFAESQNHLCVAGCSHTPISHFAENVNNQCVEAIDCPAGTFAQNTTRSCVSSCPANQWADSTTKRCVSVCPDRYYADDSTGENLCSSNCPGDYRFRDNSTVSCVDICPQSNQTFGDTPGDQCVYTCPSGYFAQVDTNRRCVGTCKSGTWGNQVSRVCITDPLNECPSGTWADNHLHLCTDLCSASQDYYGNNLTKRCVTSCPSPSFAYDGTRVCIDICPPSQVNSGYFGDPGTSPTRKCFLTCQTSNLYRDVEASRTCVTACTYNSTYKTYRDRTTMSCQPVCSTYPKVRYINDDTQTCEIQCAGSLHKDDSTGSCVATCPKYLDETTDKCVDECPRYSSSGVLYANLDTNECVVASSCPSNTYADDDSNTCVTSCPNGTYYYTNLCVYHCPADWFMDDSTQKCVEAMDCPTDQYADNQTRSCVSQCVGTFAKADIKRCIDVCYGSTYGDPFTHSCQSTCSNGLHINTANNSCQASCAVGMFKNPTNQSCSSTCPSPYYADNATRSCVQTCSANPMKFSSTSSGNRLCVSTCDPSEIHDLINRQCVSTCPSGTYSYSVNVSCVAFCPSPYFQLGNACVLNCSSENKYSDDTTRQCVSTCPTNYYKDDLTFKCVTDCPTSPSLYFISEDQGKCTTSCPEGTFADKQEGKCVTQCSFSPPTYAQETDNACVQVCPLAYSSFADENSHSCVTTCPANQFADSRSRKCVSNCSFLFADSQKNPPACVSQCTSGTFADLLTFTCVSTCPQTYFSYTPERTCLQFCPDGYYADNTTGKCVVAILCPTSHPYADHLTHECVDSCSNQQYAYIASGATYGGQCMYYCPDGFFSNPNTMTCQTSCPDGLFAETTNNTCAQSCPDDKFMDSVNNQCVDTCPAADSLFADTYNKSCLTQCDPDKFTFADSLTRKCQATCTGDQYSDNSTQTCVGPTECPSHQFSDPQYKKCVDTCYNGTYGYQGKCLTECPTSTDDVYANYETTTCTSALECPNNTYADPILKECVEFCPIQSATFADNDTKKCLTDCNSPLYADNTTRRCVSVCPDVSQLFGNNDTRKCVEKCPYLSFADETINLCVSDCPMGYFADESTLKCVEKCPEGKFGNNITNYCVDTCPSNPKYFGDPISRECVLYCPDELFADAHNNRQCQKYCLGTGSQYSQNSTGVCRSNCLTGYANERTQQCIAVCTAGYYGYNKICYTACPTVNPTVFADDSTNLCVEKCPNGTYGDLSTLKCVQICPISEGTYADDSTQQCTSLCPSGFYADESTRKCVSQCPSTPALYGYTPLRVCLSECQFGFYADNSTRLCQAGCPDNTYADSSTMKCVWTCPTKPLTFGQDQTNVCVDECSSDRNLYADNSTRTCVVTCSATDNTYADPTTRTCVSICPSNYFQVNSTRTCETGCPANTFADSLLRICVSKCPADPIFYGDPNTWTCVSECPSNSFGNPLTQECVYDSGFVSTCPPNYYSDSTTRLCVEVCPKKEEVYADPFSKSCESSCSNDYFADNTTMKCVQVCPTYPSYYADLSINKCVPFCPSNTFADDISRQCVSQCPNGTYAEVFTLRCVDKCQQQPLRFAYDGTWECLQTCPDGYFADYSTLKCVATCPLEENTFAQNSTKSCVRVCENGSFADEETQKCVSECYNTTYADSSSNRCVKQCPKYPPLYADPTTHTCVDLCPDTYYSYEDDRTCVTDCPGDQLYRQNSTRTCVSACDLSENTYADKNNDYCVYRCTVDTFADPTTHNCVTICPDQPLMYSDDSSQSCVSVCPGVTYGQNTTRSCVSTCPDESLSLPEKNLCVRYCPIGFFAYNETAFCLIQCPSPYYGDPSTRSCVDSCPLSQLLYADDMSRQCVSVCPDHSYADKKSVTCIDQCPDATGSETQTYAADYNNVCVQECALPYFAYLPTKTCVNKCPDPYYNNITDHKCHLCPVLCSSCSSLTMCTSCISTYYLEDGACVAECSTNYYASNATMTCVSSISCNPLFGVNETHECSLTCPDGSFPNTDNYRCDACQQTCQTCVTLTNCSSCYNQTEYANDFCYPYCSRGVENSSDIYYSADNQSCLSQCPDGTFLQVLFCKPCDSSCTTCVGFSTNCSLCSDGLYLQSEDCVSKCSNRYKPNKLRKCIFCGDDCGTSLDFSTNTTQINGQNTIFITFTDDVTINGDVEDVFGLVEKTNRRLLEKVGAPSYRIQIVDDKTIKIVLLDDDAQQYQVQILEPENIEDVYGNIPEKVRDQVVLDLTNTYTTTLETAPAGFSTYMAFLAAICVISFLFDIQFMKFLQLLFIHYFVAMTLPPQLSKVLIALRWSTLNYLPTMYDVPKAVLRDTVPGKIFDVCGDFSFLRNAGFAFTPLLIVILVWLLMKLLTVPQINRFKDFRIWCVNTFEQKFKFAVLYEWLGIMFLNTVFFAFLQMRDYNLYDTFSEVSVIFAHITLFFVVILYIYLIYRIISFFRESPKLSANIKKASDIILSESEYHKLNSANIFLFEMKKIDLRNIMYPKINNENILPMRNIYRFGFLSLACLIFTYLRAIIISIIIVFAYQNTILQMSLCIPLNVLCLYYFSKARPYSFKFKKRRLRNYLVIFNEVSLILFEFMLLVLGMLDQDNKSAFEKEEFSYSIIYLLTIACTVNLIYFIFRIGVQIHRKIYLPFIDSELFRNNFPEKYEELHKDKKKNLLKGIDPKAKQALKNMIKGYKKHKSSLRPSEEDHENPQLPMKLKVTYFERDLSSIESKTSMTKTQRRKVLKDIFKDEDWVVEMEKIKDYEKVLSDTERTEMQYEEFEEEVEIKVKDLANYVKNSDQLLRLKKMKQQQED